MTDVITVRSPYDDSVIGEIPAQTAADVDRAVAIAKQALHDNPLPLWKRADILDKAAARLTARREEFARPPAAPAPRWPQLPPYSRAHPIPGQRAMAIR